MFKKILLVAAMLIPMLASAQTIKIGLVDTNEIMGKMPETAEAQKKIEEVSRKYEEEYNKLGEQMKSMVDEYQNMKEDELPAIKERKARELQDFQQKLQQFEQNASQHLNTMQGELLTPIMQKMRNAIESVGREGNYSMIQVKNPDLTLFYQAPVVDITADVKAKLGIQ